MNGVPHKPNDETRAQVSALVSFGNTQEEIAKFFEISVDTLVKHYRKELDTAVLVANAKVARCLFSKAIDQDDLSAQIFWLKTRARWRETDKNIEEEKIDKRITEEIAALKAELAEKYKKEY